VDQGVERMYSLRRFGSREGVQAVAHIQLVSYVKEEDLKEGRTDLLKKVSWRQPC
jgi:hypothetical protein